MRERISQKPALSRVAGSFGKGSIAMKIRTGLLFLLASYLLLAGCTANRRQAGTGDVAFRLTWDGLSDLDLIVQDPSCDCISYVFPRSLSGGILDVDCNGGSDLMCDF